MSERFDRLVSIMARLRSKTDGCRWDIEQTHQSLKPYLLEELHETLDAIDQGDPAKIADELGDLLLQVVFHARIAEESGDFSIDQIIENLSEKLIRRHPHVFGAAPTPTESQAGLSEQWERIKSEEKLNADRLSIADQIPRSAPALIRARKISKRAAAKGFDWPDIAGTFEKLNEEIDEFKAEVERANRSEAPDRDALEDEIGDILLALVNLARKVKIDPELALDRANKKFVARFDAMEKEAIRRGVELNQANLDRLDAIWDEIKNGQKRH